MSALFNEIFYRPIFNALVLIYNYFPFADLGIAIIALTLLIRLVLLPLFFKGAKDQAIMQKLQPKLKEIQESHKNDKEKQVKAIFELYKEHKVNPLSPFLLLLVQLPILIALYTVFWRGITPEALKNLYSFVSVPESVNHYFLGMVDLGGKNYIIVILAAITQFFQGKLSLPKTPKNGEKKELSAMEMMGKQMVYMGPVLTIMFLSYLPSAVGLYWLTTSVFSVIQQIIINKQLNVGEEELVNIDKKLHGKQ